MNQEKVGKFIAENRKEKKLTQYELAEKLGVSDRTVSNWENGKNMPDLSLFKSLCDVLGITINELLSGEKLNNKKYSEKLEENFINTLDYINKKNIKNNDIKNIFWLIIGISGVFISQFIFSDYDGTDYLTVVCMILAIYSIKRFFIKYRWVRKLLAVILILMYVFSLFLK